MDNFSYYFVNGYKKKGLINVHKISTHNQHADILAVIRKDNIPEI